MAFSQYLKHPAFFQDNIDSVMWGGDIGQFPQNVFIESVIFVNNALYAIGGSPDYANQIWKLQY